jgi:hypothetical protein
MIVVVSFAMAGCHHEERVVSRVKLPEGLPTYDGKPKPRAPDLIPPAPRIEHEPKPRSLGDAVISVSDPVPEGKPLVEGACRYDGPEAVCWNPQGDPDPKLSSRVKSMLSSGSMGTTVSIVPGNKNRIVMTRFPYIDSSEGEETTVETVEDGKSSTSSMTTREQGRSVGVLFVSTPTRNKVRAVRFTERRRLPAQATIALKPGAKTQLAGSQVSVVEVKKLSEEDMNRFFVRGRPAWRVVMKPIGKLNPNLAFFPVDPYPLYLANGRRAAPPKKGGTQLIFAPKSAPNIRSVFYSELPEGSIAVLLDRDPATVKTLKLGANEELRTIVKDIPLDTR